MTDPIRAALERLHQYAEIFPVHDTDSIVARARAALSADRPSTRLAVHPDGTPMVSIGEAADLDTIARLAADPEHARAELAEPEPHAERDGLTEQDVADIAEDLEWKRLAWEEGSGPSFLLEFARAILARWGHHPAPPAEGEVQP